MNISLILDLAADTFGDRIAIGSSIGGLSFADLRDKVAEAAETLNGYHGNRIGLLGLNGPGAVIALLAGARLERPFAPLNYRLPDSDLQQLIARLSPAVIIADDDMLKRVVAADGVSTVRRSEFDRVTPAFLRPDSPRGRDLDDPVAVTLFTSGTTGSPKSAILRHRHLASYILESVEFGSAGDDEAALITVPPYHIAGVASALSNLYAGRRTVYLPVFDAGQWVTLANTERITHAMVVPTMLGKILDVVEEDRSALSWLKSMSYGGGRMPADVIERALTLLPHVDFTNAYGLTETSSTISVLTPADHWFAHRSSDPVVRGRLGSVGRPLPSIEIEIRNAAGVRLQPGFVGEIYVRGDQVAGEYEHGDIKSGDGWFATRDAGWLDEEGYLYVDGRLDDIIVRGGENISPGEIENVLRLHDGVDDAAVIGLPDDVWGERIAAIIVPSNFTPVNDASLATWVKERLRSTRTPELWLYRDVLPYNDMGKLLRRTLRSELASTAAPDHKAVAQ